MTKAMSATATAWIPFVSSIIWIALSFVDVWRDDSVTFVVGWYAPAFHLLATLTWIAILIVPSPARERVIEKGTVNHAMTMIMEFALITTYEIAMVISRDAVLVYNGALTTWVALFGIGIIALINGWEPDSTTRRNLPVADIRWTVGNYQYGLVHRVQIVDEERNIGIVEHHAEVARDGYRSGQIIDVGYEDSDGTKKTAKAEVLSTEGVIRCLVYRSH